MIGLIAALFLTFVGSATAVSTALYSHVVNGAWTSTAGVSVAQSFTTGASPADLVSVQVFWRNANESNSSSNASSTFTLRLRASSAGQPGAVVATIVTTAALGSWAEDPTVYTLGTPEPLVADTTYFIEMTGSAGGTAGWKFDSTAVTTDVTPAPVFASYRVELGRADGARLVGTVRVTQVT